MHGKQTLSFSDDASRAVIFQRNGACIESSLSSNRTKPRMSGSNRDPVTENVRGQEIAETNREEYREQLEDTT